MPEPLDLEHLGAEHVIGVYLLETKEGLALLDCGPSSCVPVLKQRLAERGLELADVQHLLLSHIHLDHAGAAGVLTREQPALKVHVSGIGAPHLIEPSRLEQSARRLYGGDFDRLWGELAPVPAANVLEASGQVLGFECFPSPGHASHHLCYQGDDGTLYAGDAAGVRIQPSLFVLPPTPPPEFDLETWERTIDELERRSPERLALIHFGVVEDPARHLGELRERLRTWTRQVEQGATRDEFVAAGKAELGEDAGRYDHAMPLWQSYAGLERYWKKRREGDPARL